MFGNQITLQHTKHVSALKKKQLVLQSVPTSFNQQLPSSVFTHTGGMVISHISLSIFLFFFFFTISSAQIPLGSTLIPTNPTNFTSPNNIFSLSFLPITSSIFSATVSFSGISVWTAGGSGTTVDSAGRFHLLSDGNLRLTNGSGFTIWESRTSNLGITSATLDDFGNLSLQNGSITIWSTFDNPTDTILPIQNFTNTKSLQSGSYSFHLLTNGNLTLKWNREIVYWNQGLNSSSTYKNPSLGLTTTGLLQLFDPTLSFPAVLAYSSDYGEGTDVLRFVRLDSDGNLRIYSSFKNTGQSIKRWAAVSDQCHVYGWCGNFGICRYIDSKAVCGCPSLNFEFVDSKDSRKGCRSKVSLESCPDNATMLKLNHTQFLTPPALSAEVFLNGIIACRENCRRGTPCKASTSLADGNGFCYIKTSGFLSGYQSAALPSTSFIKVCPPELPNPLASSITHKKTLRLRTWLVVVTSLCTLIGLVLLHCWLWLWCGRNSPKFGGLSAQYALLEYASGSPVQFTFKELQRSTKGFKEKLGAGGFGAVYRGVLANKTVVAVKQLEGIEQGEKQFRMEVATISCTHHLNLVRLIGFCSEGRHRVLVYEFMKNGSLDNSLFTVEEKSGRFLEWKARFDIALGTARGITYLHEECRDCIVHCDIKPENILLDDTYNAKVSDFGLANLVNSKEHRYRTLTSIRGTRGYLAPEWLSNLPITSKSDVYSYGMVLLEIISGRRNFEVSAETGWKKFTFWAYEEFEKGNVEKIVDKSLAELEMDMEQVTRAIGVGFWCIQEQPSHRPTMGKVVQMLEGITTIEKPPAPNAVIQGSISGTSGTTSTFSIFASSTPEPSSSISSTS